MNDRDFLDTNILVYSFDQKQPMKRDRAREIIARALRERNGIISYQVAQEFLNVALHKFTSPFSVKDCSTYIAGVLEPLCQIYPDFSLYQKAIDVLSISGFSFYDSLIVAGAIRGRCSRLLTEDLQAGREIEGITITNPFLT